VHLNEPRPEPALSPDEAHSWHAIERSLRADLPLERIERRARLRTDQALRLGAAVAIVGTVVATLALVLPVSLVLTGALASGLGTGVVVCRVAASLFHGRRLHRP
jgi:hypothetical protein